MRHENADEFMAKLKERADAAGADGRSSDLQRAAFIEGMTWGMVNELMIEIHQLIMTLESERNP